VYLVHDLVVSMTVDGTIRVFSIPKREMVAQYRLDELLAAAGHAEAGKSMIAWFHGNGGSLAVRLKECSLVLR
jgi:hypothetical protein